MTNARLCFADFLSAFNCMQPLILVCSLFVMSSICHSPICWLEHAAQFGQGKAPVALCRHPDGQMNISVAQWREGVFSERVNKEMRKVNMTKLHNSSA